MNKSVHPVDERLPLGQTFLYGLQHVLAMYAGAVAVPLLWRMLSVLVQRI